MRHLARGGDLFDAVLVDDDHTVRAGIVLDECGPAAGLGCDVAQHAVGCEHT